jgi:hypothetical protein
LKGGDSYFSIKTYLINRQRRYFSNTFLISFGKITIFVKIEEHVGYDIKVDSRRKEKHFL